MIKRERFEEYLRALPDEDKVYLIWLLSFNLSGYVDDCGNDYLTPTYEAPDIRFAQSIVRHHIQKAKDHPHV